MFEVNVKNVMEGREGEEEEVEDQLGFGALMTHQPSDIFVR